MIILKRLQGRHGLQAGSGDLAEAGGVRRESRVATRRLKTALARTPRIRNRKDRDNELAAVGQLSILPPRSVAVSRFDNSYPTPLADGAVEARTTSGDGSTTVSKARPGSAIRARMSRAAAMPICCFGR